MSSDYNGLILQNITMSSNNNETPELLKRRADGKAGKLWHIEVLYCRGVETGRHTLSNLYWAEVLEFRERVFKAGLMKPKDPGHWIVISPYDVTEINLEKQSAYFNDMYGR